MKSIEGISSINQEDRFIDILGQVPLFDSFETNELAMLAKHMNFVGIDKDALLFREGDKGDYVCFVLEGSLDVIKKTENNDFIKIATLTKGDSIGEMSILDQIVRSATIKACETSKVVSLSKNDFELILNDYPKIGVKILKGLSRYMSLNMRRTSRLFADMTENYMSLLEDYRTTF